MNNIIYGDKIVEQEGYPYTHREFVLKGAPFSTGEHVFHLLVEQGLEEDSYLLDFGCGSLRVGRFLMMYLNPSKYFGIEPNKWLLEAAFDNEIGHDLVKIKQPKFAYNNHFNARSFKEQKFDFVLLSGVLTHMDHTQLEKTLVSAEKILNDNGKIVGSIIPIGPDHTYEGWLYPQQAAHYPDCIKHCLPNINFQQLTVDDGGAMWFSLSK